MLTDESKYARRIWRALDAETSFFGIRGRFIVLFLLMAALGLVCGFCLMVAAGNLVGTLGIVTALVTAYFCVLSVQSRMTVRQFSRMISKRKLKHYCKVRPGSVRSQLNDTIKWK